MRDDVPPWSFFLPVTLAVMVGVLLADGIKVLLRITMPAVVAQRDQPPAQPQPLPVPRRDAGAVAPPAESLPRIAPTRAVADPSTGAAPVEAPAVAFDVAGDTVDPAAGAEQAPVSEGGPATAPSAGALPDLPGPMTAMRDSAEQACIGGTVADRRRNGWEQALEGDRPQRCNATSP